MNHGWVGDLELTNNYIDYIRDTVSSAVYAFGVNGASCAAAPGSLVVPAIVSGNIDMKNGNPVSLTNISTRVATINNSSPSPAVVTASNAFITNGGEPFKFFTTGTLPVDSATNVPLVANQVYYVLPSPTSTYFNFASTPNGAAIITTTAGSGTQTITIGGCI